jgi:hypothetical protein
VFDRKPYITVTEGMRGFFAVYLVWNDDHDGFYEPEQTGCGSYDNPDEAAQEARWWARDEDVDCTHPGPLREGDYDE